MDSSVPPEEEIINIEAIMQEIRQQILAKKDVVRTPGSTPLFVQGRRLPPAFYEHLYQAGLAHHQIGVSLHVSKSSTPLIGPLLDRARQVAHQLVIFYVNKLAAEQIQFNTHILHALNLLAQELEKEENNHER